MGFGPIQFGGLASGLDTGSIISALMALERRPIQLLESRKSTEESKLELFSTFENLVRELRDQAAELGAGNTFYANKLQVSDESVASITVSPGAETGSHELRAIALAKADRFTFDGLAASDDEALLGAGQISFDYRGETYTIDVTDTMTLQGVADAINSHSQLNGAGDDTINAGDAVTANVVNVGTEDNPSYQLVIAGDETGADFSIQNLTVGAGIGLTGQTQLTTAQNAQAEIDGLLVERSDNLFTGVIPGVTFTLTSEDLGQGAGAPFTSFTIDVDPEGVKENVQGFIDAYNAVIDFIEEQSEITLDEGDDTSVSADSNIFGDPALSSVRGALQGAFFEVDLLEVQTSMGFATLNEVGIERDIDGRLSIDDLVFDEKLAEDLDAVANLFLEDRDVDDATGVVNDPGGLLARIEVAIDGLIENVDAVDATGNPILDAQGDPIVVDGLFNRRRDTINSIIRDMDDQIDRLEDRLVRTEESLVARFSNLEELLAGLNAQQAYLNQVLGF